MTIKHPELLDVTKPDLVFRIIVTTAGPNGPVAAVAVTFPLTR